MFSALEKLKKARISHINYANLFIMTEARFHMVLSFISAIVRISCLYGDFVFDDKVAIVNNKDVFNHVNAPWFDLFKHDL